MNAATNDLPLRIDTVSFAYAGNLILENLSFSVSPGAFTVLLGINGAGKTTLFSLITRLYSPGNGKITVFGHDLEKHSAKALARMGVVFQQPTLDLDLTIRQNLLYHAALHAVPADHVKLLVDEQLSRYMPGCSSNRKIHKLSGGQKRSVELIRSLLHKPQLLLLDEPTVGLDIKNRAQFIRNVRELCDTSDVGVLWATHLIDEVDNTDHVVIIHQGKVLANDVVSQVLQETNTTNIGEAFSALTSVRVESMTASLPA